MKYLILVLLFLSNISIYSQEIMTLDQVIQMALEKNFDILRMNNNLAIADNNKRIWNSGYLPTVGVNLGAGYSVGNSLFVLKNDTEVEFNDAKASNYSGGIALNYMLFNGFARKNKLDNFKAQYELADNQTKMVINDVISRLNKTYYAIARAELRKEILKEAYEISKERLVRATYQFEYGQSTKLQMLNAQVDANNDSLLVENIKVQIDNAKRNLNFLIDEDIDKPIVVDTQVAVDETLDYDYMKNKILQENNEVMAQRLNRVIAQNNIKISKSNYLPSLSLIAGYSLNHQEFDNNIQFQSQNIDGLNAGLSLNWNIFGGGRTKTQVQNNKIRLKNIELGTEQVQLALINELATLWADYNYQMGLVESEKLNVALSNQNFLRTEERYNLGQISSIEFRQAQLNLINSKMNLNQALFNTKTAEIELRILSGDLL